MTDRRNLQSVLDAVQSGTCVITSNTRAARNLKRTFAERQLASGLTTWQSPDILPWSAWLQRFWHERIFRSPGQFTALLDEGQERFLWERCIANERAKLDAAALASQCTRAWKSLHAFRVPREKAAFRRKPDTAAFLRWSNSYESTCERNGWLDEARLPDQLHATAVAVLRGREIIFWGFDSFTPQQESFVAVLRAAGIRCGIAQPDGVPASASRIALEDSRAELYSAALWARKLLAANPDATIGVVIPNIEDLRAAAERVFLEILHPEALTIAGTETRRAFELSLGVPLAQVPIIAAGLSLFELAARPQPLEAVSRVLRSPFVGAAEELGARAALDTRIRSRGFVELSLDALKDLAGDWAGCRRFASGLRAFDAAVTRLAGRRAPSAWSREALPALAVAGWPGSRSVNSREYQAQRAFADMLSDFARLDLVAELLDFPAMVRRLVRTADETLFQPENLGAPIQLVGMLEASGSHFDHMWITGMHSAAWPPEPSPSPFLPIDLQRLHGVRGASAAERLEYAQTTLDRLLRSASEVVISYPMRERDVELTASPLIANFHEVERPLISAGPVASYERSLFAAAETVTALDEQGPLVTEPISSGGTQIFKLQAACPFHAFAELRLEARELQMPVPGLDYRLRGTLLHKSLEGIWAELQSQSGLASKSQVELEELVGRQVGRSIQECGAVLVADWEHQIVQIERERLTRLILDLLEQEKKRPAAFRVTEHEHKAEVTLGGVTANVQVDRIDELEDGSLVLLDYKTGKPSVNHWEGDRPEDPQLPIYATQLGSRLAAVAFVRVNKEEIAFKGFTRKAWILPSPTRSFEWLSEKQRPAPTFDEMLAGWNKTLTQLGTSFRNGESAVDPKNRKRTCERCHLGMLCRVNEAPLEPEEEDDAG